MGRRWDSWRSGSGKIVTLHSTAHKAAKKTVLKYKSLPPLPKSLPFNHSTSLPAKAKSLEGFMALMICSQYLSDLTPSHSFHSLTPFQPH